MPHEGHENHLCALHGDGLLKDKPEEWKKSSNQKDRRSCRESR